MAKRCYYESLSIERTATDIDIKAAFRKQAMQCHPDRNPGDQSAEHRFKEINEAYEILKDPDKRAAYDRYGHAAFEQGMGGGAAGFGAEFGTTFSDLFEGIFGMSGGSRPRYRPRARRRFALQYGNRAYRRPMRARMRKCAFRPRSPARPAPAPAPRPAPNLKPVRCAAAKAGFATPRDFSRSSAPARTAMAVASRSTARARHAPAPAASRASGLCR